MPRFLSILKGPGAYSARPDSSYFFEDEKGSCYRACLAFCRAAATLAIFRKGSCYPALKSGLGRVPSARSGCPPLPSVLAFTGF
jgi:hypothetical protein